MDFFNLITAVVFFIFHVGDIVTDVVACITYYNNGFDAFFKATLAFILVPFGYTIFLGPQETGGLDGVSVLGGYGYTLVSYFIGPLFPFVFKGRLSDENLRKVEGITIFGSGYMEDIPQVIIACFFVFSKHNKEASNQEKLTTLIQLGFSAISGIYKIFNGARKIGNGRVNCCGRNMNC